MMRFTGKALDANSYFLNDGKDALLFDASGSDEMISYLKYFEIKSVSLFLTHEHYDHILGVEALRNNFDCKVYASVECSKRIQSPKTNLSSIADVLISMHDHSEIAKKVPEFSASEADAIFDCNGEFVWHDHIIKCHILAGHSPGSVCYIMDGNMLFSGDELLAIPVITRFPGGSTEKFWKEDMPWFESIKSNISLVFPGHGQPGNMKDMLKANIMPEKFRR